MLSCYLDRDLARLNEHVKKIKKTKPSFVALQGAPRLTQDEIKSKIIAPLDREYKVFRGDVITDADNLLVVRRELYNAKLVRDPDSITWMLKSNVSICGVVLEATGPESEENRLRQLVFSVFVEPGADKNGIIDSAYFMRRMLLAEKLTSSNLVLLCEFVDENYIKMFEQILDIDLGTNVKPQRRATRKSACK